MSEPRGEYLHRPEGTKFPWLPPWKASLIGTIGVVAGAWHGWRSLPVYCFITTGLFVADRVGSSTADHLQGGTHE